MFNMYGDFTIVGIRMNVRRTRPTRMARFRW